jgi:hypothetical protein
MIGRGKLPAAYAKRECQRVCGYLKWDAPTEDAAEAAGIWSWMFAGRPEARAPRRAIVCEGAGMSAALVKYDAMCRAIDAAYKVDEVKEIRNKAVALEHYARQAKNVEAERLACEIRLRAERRAGQLLASMEKAKGALKRGQELPRSNGTTTEVLRDLGISEDQSSKWQKVAAVPQRSFDEALQQAERPTTNGIIRATTAPKVNPVSSEALWLWGRLRDFEDDGLLAKEPADVMETMNAEMKDEVHVLAPREAAWLKRIGGGVVSRDSTLQDLGISREAGRTGPLFAGGAE